MSMRFIPNPSLRTEWEQSEDAWSALDMIGEEIVSVARSNAPVDTGRLRDSISAHRSPGPEGGAGTQVLADVPYARYVEFGDSRQSPEPFLRPALDEVVG